MSTRQQLSSNVWATLRSRSHFVVKLSHDPCIYTTLLPFNPPVHLKLESKAGGYFCTWPCYWHSVNGKSGPQFRRPSWPLYNTYRPHRIADRYVSIRFPGCTTAGIGSSQLAILDGRMGTFHCRLTWRSISADIHKSIEI